MFSLKVTHLGCCIFGTSCINCHLIINWSVIFYFDWPNPLTGWCLIVRNESFNKSNNFKKEFGCRMCTYTKLFVCITIAKELALFKAVSTLRKERCRGSEQALCRIFLKTPRWNPSKIFFTLCGLSKGPITHHFEIITPVSLW